MAAFAVASQIGISACAAATTGRHAGSGGPKVATIVVSGEAGDRIAVDGQQVASRADMVTYLRQHDITGVRFRSRVKLIVLQTDVCAFYLAFRDAGVTILEFRVPTAFNSEGYDWSGKATEEFCQAGPGA
jgi:hypothetical protein